MAFRAVDATPFGFRWTCLTTWDFKEIRLALSFSSSLVTSNRILWRSAICSSASWQALSSSSFLLSDRAGLDLTFVDVSHGLLRCEQFDT
jgi:hypothetical protein